MNEFFKEFWNRSTNFTMAILGLTLFAGCLGPLSLERAIIEYDESILEAEKDLILINIARIANGQPPHFIAVESIAAGFDFTTTSGISHKLFSKGFNINETNLSLGASASEQPTATLKPIQGDEFTKRLKTPISKAIIGTFLIQGTYSFSTLFPLTVGYLQLEDRSSQKAGDLCLIPNSNSDTEYNSCKKKSWASIKDFQEFLIFLNQDSRINGKDIVLKESFRNLNEEITFPATCPEDDCKNQIAFMNQILTARKAGYSWRKKNDSEHYQLSEMQGYNLILINYEEKDFVSKTGERLRRQSASHPYPEGSMSVHFKNSINFKKRNKNDIEGLLRFRSFIQILEALAEQMNLCRKKDSPKFCAKSDRLIVKTGEEIMDDQVLHSVEYQDSYYWIPSNEESGKLFSLVYQIFQMSKAESKTIAPLLTIPTR